MNTKELIKNYKTPFTPMEENTSLFPLYVNYPRQTAFLENDPICIIIHSDNIPNIELFIPTLSKSFLENKNREYIKLYTEFLIKWEEKQMHFGNFSKAFVFEKIKEVIDSFLTLNPSYVTFDLTEDCSIF